jgi:hypothetical protein
MSDTKTTVPTKITNQGIAIFAISCASAMTFGAFWLSRGDHDLKLMSLQAVLTLGGTLLGIAGTLLVGVQAYRSLTADLPPGSRATENSMIETPPIAPVPPEE